MPGVVIAGSLLLTNLSAEQLVGTNGQTWAIGMSPMAFEVMAATALIVLALFAAPRYLKSGITTIPQLLGERYDRPTKLWFSIAYIILYLFVQIPVILYSGSLVFENIFNLSGILGITKFQSIVILCILITIIHRLDLRHLRRSEGCCSIGYHQRRGPADRRSDDSVSGTQRARSCLRQ